MTLGDLIAQLVPDPGATLTLTGAELAVRIREIAGELVPARVKDVVCPQCKRPFLLVWSDYASRTGSPQPTPYTLSVRSCPSGGVYDVSVECPHCDYTEPL